MMDGLYEFRLLTPTAMRFGVLLKHDAVLVGRAGDWATLGRLGIDEHGPLADLLIWDIAQAGDESADRHAGTHIRLRGLVSRGGARLAGDREGDDVSGLRLELSLFRAPPTRAVDLW